MRGAAGPEAGDIGEPHAVPAPVVVGPLAADLDAVRRGPEAEHQLALVQDQSHEVLPRLVRHVEQQPRRRLRPQGQGEVGPGGKRPAG